MIKIISILHIDFSVLSAGILLVAYLFFLKNVNKQWYARASCAGLLISLTAFNEIAGMSPGAYRKSAKNS